MAVPKNTQTRFVGITYHTHYTSLRLLFEYIAVHTHNIIIIYGHMQEWKSIRKPMDSYTLHTESELLISVYMILIIEKSKRRDV